MDAFILSHTASVVDVVDQEIVDRYLPPCHIPHVLDHKHPVCVGGLAWPRETASMRHDHVEAMERVPHMVEQARQEFGKLVGRTPDGMIRTWHTADAEMVLVTASTITSTARDVVNELRSKGVKIGLCKVKMYRPFPRAQILEAIGHVPRIGVIDRNISLGSGGMFWNELVVTFQRKTNLVQDYILGLTGSDITPEVIQQVVDDLAERTEVTTPIWKGVAA
jgi:pyruvate ferredoxin oxidoreductase alpha subunit